MALMLTAPHALVAAMAWGATAAPLPRTSALPLAAILVLVVQLIGFGLADRAELAAWRRVWAGNIIVVALLWPLLAMHGGLAGAPHVAVERGTATPVVLTAVASAAVLLGTALVTAGLTADEPERASLLFVPATVLVPAILGTTQDLSERLALEALAEGYLVAAVVLFPAWLTPRAAWPFFGPLALGVQFCLLWLVGWRPAVERSSEDVVPLASGGLLGITVLLTVAVPPLALLARWIRRELSGDAD